MQPVDDLKLHQFFFRRAKNLVLLEAWLAWISSL